MKDLTIIGLDTAKNFIQIHGADAKGKRLIKKRLARDNFINYMVKLPRCLIGMEACSGAHYWATKLVEMGFEVKLMSPVKVKKFVENNKNDAKDAEACAEAVGRSNMSFVPIKNPTQLEMQALHRVRSYYVKQRTGIMNMMRGLLHELGIVVRKGQVALIKKMTFLLDDEDPSLSVKNKTLFRNLYKDLKEVDHTIDGYTQQLEKNAKGDENCKRIQTIEGIGPLTATALISKIGNGSEFKKGRDLSAFLGLVPKQHSSGEKTLLRGISKHGDRYIRQLLVHGGRACVQAATRKNKTTGFYCKQDKHSQWIRKLTERVGVNKASVAVANKNARMVVALLKNQTTFQPALAH